MSEHNIQHEKTQEELLKYISELRARMEEAQARVSRLRTLALQLPKEDLERGEHELSSVISELDTTRNMDYTITLPDELLINIVRYVPSKYMYQLGAVDRRWARLMKEPPMLKLERSLRWATNNTKYLQVDNVLPDKIVKNILYEGGKLYIYIDLTKTDEGDVDSKQIMSGTISILDPNMTGVFTAHGDKVYYAVHTDTGQNKIVKYSTGESSEAYDSIECMVVHGDYLYFATARRDIRIVDNLTLAYVGVNQTPQLLRKLVACENYVVGLGLHGLLMIFIAGEGETKLGVRTHHLTSADFNGKTICDIAATKRGQLCVYLVGAREFTLGTEHMSSQIAYVFDDSNILFSKEERCESPFQHHYQCAMGITGDYLYVNTLSGDFCIVNLITMQSALIKMGTDYKFSRVVLTLDHSLVGLLTKQEQIIRFHWDAQ